MILWFFWPQCVKNNGPWASACRLPPVLLAVLLWSWNFGLIARSAFEVAEAQELRSVYWEQYELHYACAQDFQGYSRSLPCPKCRIMPAGDGQILTLVAADKAALAELRDFVGGLDRPAEQLVVSICCILVQEQEVAPFLEALMQRPQLFYRSWQEGVLQLVTEMQREGAVIVLATPQVAVEVGRRAELLMHDESLLHTDHKALENYGLALELKLQCLKRGPDKYLVDVHFMHQLFLKSQAGLDPKQRKELRTQLSLKRGERGFLGSAGHWGLVQEQGRFNLLRILPHQLVPALHDKRELNTELILLVGLE